MQSRVARLEVLVEHIERDIAQIKNCMEADFRITWAGIIATNLGLGGLMAKGFGWL